MADSARGAHRIAITSEVGRHFGIGKFKRGNILIIGEQPARAHLGINTPFSEDKGCSGWLNRLLDGAEIPEESLFWANALNNDNSELDIAELKRALKPSHILTLGGVARKLCEKHDIVHERFYHPSYWKRFHSKEPYAFIIRLLWIINEKSGKQMV
jgi:hypothetical protein